MSKFDELPALVRGLVDRNGLAQTAAAFEDEFTRAGVAFPAPQSMRAISNSLASRGASVEGDPLDETDRAVVAQVSQEYWLSGVLGSMRTAACEKYGPRSVEHRALTDGYHEYWVAECPKDPREVRAALHDVLSREPLPVLAPDMKAFYAEQEIPEYQSAVDAMVDRLAQVRSMSQDTSVEAQESARAAEVARDEDAPALEQQSGSRPILDPLVFDRHEAATLLRELRESLTLTGDHEAARVLLEAERGLRELPARENPTMPDRGASDAAFLDRFEASDVEFER